MTTRTIMRRLKDEGASFQQIKDLVRRDKAINLLTYYALPIKEVAERIGYSDPAVFAPRISKLDGAISPYVSKEHTNQ